MAFSLDHNVAIFDSTNQTLAGLHKVRRAVWSGYTNAAHKLVVQHRDAKTYADVSAGNTVGFMHMAQFDNAWIQDMKVTTLGSGKFYVYLE